MSKMPIILDCDPGHDDAIAIILAAVSDTLDLKAITTVGGNQTVAKTTKNALNILSFIKKDIPVAKGADQPIRRPLEIAPEVHGDSGLDGPVLPQSDKKAVDINAYDLMAQIIEKSDEKVTLVATGPLTNIAIFLISNPHLHHKIEQISIMGGCAIGGNWTASAEFNILVDPEAAAIVFRSGIPVIMAGLDVTHKAQIREKEIAQIKAQGGKVAIFVGELLDFFIKFHKEVVGFDFAPLHDPCAIAYLINPKMFKSKKVNVEIDLAGEHTVGATVADLRGVTNRKPNVELLLDVDIEQYMDLIIESVNKYH